MRHLIQAAPAEAEDLNDRQQKLLDGIFHPIYPE